MTIQIACQLALTAGLGGKYFLSLQSTCNKHDNPRERFYRGIGNTIGTSMIVALLYGAGAFSTFFG